MTRRFQLAKRKTNYFPQLCLKNEEEEAASGWD